MSEFTILQFVTELGNNLYTDYLARLNDSKAVHKIVSRVQRMAGGNFGDCKSLGGGVFELRIDYGPGYRVYYCLEGKKIVLLLCAGDKSTQSQDIKKAIEYKANFERRNL